MGPSTEEGVESAEWRAVSSTEDTVRSLVVVAPESRIAEVGMVDDDWGAVPSVTSSCGDADAGVVTAFSVDRLPVDELAESSGAGALASLANEATAGELGIEGTGGVSGESRSLPKIRSGEKVEKRAMSGSLGLLEKRRLSSRLSSDAVLDSTESCGLCWGCRGCWSC